jgi:NitT/TauT family transport system ATP-binding protein
MDKIIICKNIVKTFENLLVIDNVSFSVAPGEFLVILGPSGCGKSTFLNMIAGFEKPTSGEIIVMNSKVTKPNRNYGFVFQDYALFPWLTVLGNVESGLINKTKKERKEIAEYYINLVSLGEFKNEYPYKLSGGMKQRVSLARALAYEPPILLMDEPFGALDAQTRKLMQQELLRILKDFNKTIVFVTHSVVEAVYLASRVIVLSKRPSHIIYEEYIDIEGERHFTGEKFNFYREKILHYLNQETGVKE